MEINLKNYKNSLYDNLIKNKDDATKNRLALAQAISSSVPAYLSDSPDMNNKTEKEIHLYARQLMNDVLQGKTDYNQIITQMEMEDGITLGYIETLPFKHVEIQNPTPLMTAILEGNYREFRRLIKDGADVNESRKARKTNGKSFNTITLYPLTLAVGASTQPYKYMKILLEAGARIFNSDGVCDNSQALFLAQDNLDMQVIKGLKKAAQLHIDMHQSDVFNERDTPLLAMMRNRYYNSAKVLIQAGANVNLANKNEQTPLDLAIEDKNYSMAKLLIESGADVNKQILEKIDTYFKDEKLTRTKLLLLIKKVNKQKAMQQKKEEQQNTSNKLTKFLKNIFSNGRK